jgi:hypothetical protein
MAAGRAADLLLFVTSTGLHSPFDARLKVGQCECRSPESALPPSPKDRPAVLPRHQLHCMNTVLRIARSTGRSVTVVDVGRAAGRQHLVDRWVGTRDVLPLLVRPDGRRLEGAERFGAETIREFLAAA